MLQYKPMISKESWLNRPTGQSLELLMGEISEPTSLSDGSSVQLVESGSGMAGLTGHPDNINWSGIFHHIMLSTRIAHNLCLQLQRKGHEIDSNVVLQAGIDSHLGRRIWDEAKKYPQLVKKSDQKLSVTNESIGLDMLREAEVDAPIYETVAALAHGVECDPSWYETHEYKIFSYVDHRTMDKVYSYSERMGTFLINAFIPKEQVTDDKRQAVYQMVKDIFARVKQGEQIELETIVKQASDLGATPTSDRLKLDSFMHMIIEDAQTELMLEKAGIDTSNLNATPHPRWERYLRRLYLMDAEKSVFEAKKRINEIIEQYQVNDGHTPNDVAEMEKRAGFDPQRWGTGEFNKLYFEQEGVPYKSPNKSSRPLYGWARAVWFFQYLDNQNRGMNAGELLDVTMGLTDL